MKQTNCPMYFFGNIEGNMDLSDIHVAVYLTLQIETALECPLVYWIPTNIHSTPLQMSSFGILSG